MKQWNDWSDLMKGNIGSPPDSRSKDVTIGPTLRKGEVPRRPTDAEIREYILKGAPQQPSNEALFGHLEVTEEMAKKAQNDWEGVFTKFFKTKHEPIEKNQSPSWGRGPVDQNDVSKLTEEEKRVLAIPVNPNAR